MASIEIKTSDPRMAAGIAEGAAAVALRTVQEENRQLKAVDGVRREADARRWQRTRRRLARKYATERHGRLYGAVWGLIGGAVLVVDGWRRYFQRWNRES